MTILDRYSMMIVSKYLSYYMDFVHLVCVCKNYKEIPEMFHYNPISNTTLFPNIETQYLYDKTTPLIHTIPLHHYCFDMTYSYYLRIANPNSTFQSITYTEGDRRVHGINIPKVVTSLGYQCFHGCKTLETIQIPSTVRSIASLCFSSCKNLHSIQLPIHLTSFALDSFENCSSLTSITIPNTTTFKLRVTYTLSELFKRGGITCTNIEYTYEDRQIYGCSIPNGVITLGNYSFANCDNLFELVLPSTIQYINQKAFVETKSLTTIRMEQKQLFTSPIPLHVANLLKKTGIQSTHILYTRYDRKIYGINIPTDVLELDEKCYYGCYELISLVIPNSITSIPFKCFKDCSSLKSIILPISITSLGDECFSNCSSLSTLSLPNSIKTLGASCFSNCIKLSSITLPSRLTFLGDNCFKSCSSIQYITINSPITTIPPHCFNDCQNLSNITLSTTITIIANNAFHNCKVLNYITIPTTVVFIGKECFKDSGLEEIQLHDTHVLGEGCFERCLSLNTITINGNLNVLQHKTFYQCTSLSSIQLPSTIRMVGDQTFYQCSSLHQLTLPTQVTKLGDQCFQECNTLKDITLTTIEKIGIDCFEGSLIRHKPHKKKIKQTQFNSSCIIN
ncbi:hypothetical protein QTN25_008741 [Entamoeba marina]